MKWKKKMKSMKYLVCSQVLNVPVHSKKNEVKWFHVKDIWEKMKDNHCTLETLALNMI